MLAVIRQVVEHPSEGRIRDGVPDVQTEDWFFCTHLPKVGGSVAPMRVLQQFGAETFIPAHAGSPFQCPLGVHGLYLLNDPELKKACPEIDLIRRGTKWKNYNQDFGHTGGSSP
jgi:hypothetical protein